MDTLWSFRSTVAQVDARNVYQVLFADCMDIDGATVYILYTLWLYMYLGNYRYRIDEYRKIVLMKWTGI